ncbi:Hypothetical predicted protein [Mytilus galloprovincialis]|uniref:Uncharacterized protein n=1 Tax=Mytilus galloprovincialis TaxID=29158 RepID=A0A8B6BJA6_MYTGA|nr:Hypothetical predicted protein [Mytilus galloprovincialis]
MDEEPSTSCGIKRRIPSELQDNINAIATKYSREAAISAALNDNQKRWLVIGICLHTILSPALRKWVESILTIFQNDLINNYNIDTQMYSNQLRSDPQNGVFLNYETVNNNKTKYGKNYPKYDYTIKNAVELSKLYLQTNMAHYTGFDDTCDISHLLCLILEIARFDPVIKADADNVRKNVRNPWAHCDFTEWDASKYSSSFQLLKKLVHDLKLNLNEETLIIEEMEKWEINGECFLSGTTYGFELFHEVRQQTHVLAVYATLVATEADGNFIKIRDKIEKFENIFNKIAQLDKELKKGFSEIDKRLLAQDNTLKTHSTHIGK